MKINKKGNIGSGTVVTYAYGFIVLVVFFLIVAELIPEVGDAGNEINDTGYAFSNLFASDGLVILVIMAGILLLVVKAFLGRGK